MFQRIAIDLARARQQETRAFVSRQTKRLVRSERAHLQGLDRQFEIVDRTRRRREVPDVVHRPFEEEELSHILLDESERLIPRQMGDVVGRSRHQVVDHDDLMPLGKEQVGQVGSKESRSTGNHGNRSDGLCSGLFFGHTGSGDRFRRSTLRPCAATRPGWSGRGF